MLETYKKTRATLHSLLTKEGFPCSLRKDVLAEYDRSPYKSLFRFEPTMPGSVAFRIDLERDADLCLMTGFLHRSGTGEVHETRLGTYPRERRVWITEGLARFFNELTGAGQ